MEIPTFVDGSGDKELVGSSVLTSAPSTIGDRGDIKNSIPSAFPKSFGEDLSIASLVKNSGGTTHSVTSQNVIAFADLVKCELQDKQKLIELLMTEVKDKADAIEICGKDIRRLREENLLLENRTRALQDDQNQTEQFIQDLLNSIKLKTTKEILPAKTVNQKALAKCVEEFITNLHSVVQENTLLQDNLRFKDEELKSLATVKQRCAELEISHQHTLQYLKSMKSEIGKLESYRMTVITQERVIAKLQSVVESKLKSKFSFLKDVSAAIKVEASQIGFPPLLDPTSNTQSHTGNIIDEDIRQENFTLKEKLKSMEAAMVEMQQQLDHQTQPSRPSTRNSQVSSLDGDDEKDDDHFDGQVPSNFKNLTKANLRIDQLIAEIVSKQFRIEALEHQMELASRESSREIARLRTKLFELEISLSLLTTPPVDQEETFPEEPNISPDLSISVEDLKPDVLGNISPQNRQGTIIVPQTSISPQKIQSETILQTPKGGERTRADSGFDIDRIPTPEDLPKLFNSNKTEQTSIQTNPAKDQSASKKRKEVVKEGIVERTFALYQHDGEDIQDPTVMGVATIRFQYIHDKIQKSHIFTMTRIKVENYPLDEVKPKFELFSVVSVFGDRENSLWKIETPGVRDPGSMVQWDHDPSQAADDKKFVVSATDFFEFVNSDYGMLVSCTLKKKFPNEKDGKVIGTGSTTLLFAV